MQVALLERLADVLVGDHDGVVRREEEAVAVSVNPDILPSPLHEAVLVEGLEPPAVLTVSFIHIVAFVLNVEP